MFITVEVYYVAVFTAGCPFRGLLKRSMSTADQQTNRSTLITGGLEDQVMIMFRC